MPNDSSKSFEERGVQNRFSGKTGLVAGASRLTLCSWGGWTYFGGNTGSDITPFNDGITRSATGTGTLGVNGPTATEGSGQLFGTGTTINSSSGIYSGYGSSGPPKVSWTLGILNSCQHRVLVFDTIGVRYWIGALDGTVSTPIGSSTLLTDVPLSSFVGFRYSSIAGDTNWQAVVNKAGSQTVKDTGVPLDTTLSHVLEVQSANNGATVNFLIDGLLVASISDGNVPASSQVFRNIALVNNTIGGANKRLQVNGSYFETSR